MADRAHPLGSLAAGAADCPAAQLALLAPATRLVIRADTAAAAILGAAFGVLLGTVPHRSVLSRDRAALWLGPDEWLVLAPSSETSLAQAATAAVASIVDVSHRQIAIGISGPQAAWCINTSNALDLDLRAFPIGACARTLFGKAEIVLWRIEAEHFHIEVARSYAAYVWQCLEAARREFLPRTAAC